MHSVQWGYCNRASTVELCKNAGNEKYGTLWGYNTGTLGYGILKCWGTLNRYFRRKFVVHIYSNLFMRGDGEASCEGGVLLLLLLPLHVAEGLLQQASRLGRHLGHEGITWLQSQVLVTSGTNSSNSLFSSGGASRPLVSCEMSE